MVTTARILPDIHQLILAQLPETLRPLVQLRVTTDPYYLKTRVEFWSHSGLKHIIDAELERERWEDRSVAFKMPDELISWLCLTLGDEAQKRSRIEMFDPKMFEWVRK